MAFNMLALLILSRSSSPHKRISVSWLGFQLAKTGLRQYVEVGFEYELLLSIDSPSLPKYY